MENNLLSLSVYYKKEIAQTVLLQYHRRYKEFENGMYSHWSHLNEQNGKLFLVKSYQHESSCVCNQEVPVNIDQIFNKEYDYIICLIKEHISEFDWSIGNTIRKLIK